MMVDESKIAVVKFVAVNLVRVLMALPKCANV